MTIYIATADDNNTRLDRWLKRYEPTLNQGQIEKLLRKGAIRVNNQKVPANHRLEIGQEVKLPKILTTHEPLKPRRPKPEPMQLALPKEWILFEDKDMIVINKPFGIASQGGSKTKTHIDGMLNVLTQETGQKYHLIHRIDKDTSGILVIAKSPQAAAHLTKAFRERRVEKTYWAVVVGVPPKPEGTIKLALRKGNGKYGEQMVIDQKEGQIAITTYKILDYLSTKAALLQLSPETGRTHQLRVHCQALGTPILGDGKYGLKEQDDSFGITGSKRKLHLWARDITVTLTSGKQKTILAPIPPHIKETFKDLGFQEKY